MKQIIRRIAALVIGLGLGATALAGLESVTHISDLNSAWPLGSDLASTSDDHIRNIKVALKTDFPNVNAAVTPTPTQFNQLTTDTFTNLAVTSSTIPVNGIYLPAANTLGFASNSTKWGSVNSTGNWIFNTPSSGPNINLGGTSVSWGVGSTAAAMQLQSSGLWAFDNGSGNIQTELNTNVYQSALGVYKYAQTAAALRFREVIGTGFLFDYAASGSAGGTPSFTTAMQINQTGTIQGAGPVAAALVDMTPDNGSWTATFSGAISTTGTVKWRRIGNQAFIYVDANITATAGSATTITFNGVPAAITPAAARLCVTMIFNNGANAVGTATMNTNNTVTLWPGFGPSANFTNGVVDGIASGATIIYPL